MKKWYMALAVVSCSLIFSMQGATDIYQAFSRFLQEADPEDHELRSFLAIGLELFPKGRTVTNQQNAKTENLKNIFSKMFDMKLDAEELTKILSNQERFSRSVSLCETANKTVVRGIEKLQKEREGIESELQDAETNLAKVQGERKALHRALNLFSLDFLDLVQALNDEVAFFARPHHGDEEEGRELFDDLVAKYAAYQDSVRALNRTALDLGIALTVDTPAFNSFVESEINSHPQYETKEPASRTIEQDMPTEQEPLDSLAS